MAERTLQRVRSRFTWDATSLRYRLPNGQFVPADRVRRALLDVVRGSKRTIISLAKELTAGRMSVGAWQAAMETAVKDLNLAATMAAKGGPGAMTPRDFGLAGARIRFHYERIDVFSRLIEDGRLSAGQVTARAQLYANAGAGIYENARREAAQGVMTEERRALAKAEHCGVCVEEAAKGWQPIGTLRRIGDSPCRANCRCTYRFRAA
jgi:hypothetical protein